MAKGLWTILNVGNVDKTVEFYKALGLRASANEIPGLGRYGEIDTGGSGIIFWPKDNVAPGQPADTREWLSGELGRGVLVSIGVPNARKLWEKAQALRFDVDTPLRDQEWGGTEFSVVDPDGYVVNITDKFPASPPKRATRKAKPAARTAKKTNPRGKTSKRR